MTRSEHPARRAARQMIRMAAIGAVLTATAIAAGAGPTAAQQVVNVRLNYTCAFPGGAQQVGVRVGTAFPDSGTVGQLIQPANTTIIMSLPRSVVAVLVKLHAATVTATVSLTTVVAQGGAAANAAWAGLRAPSTALPGKGPLVLTASGAAPSAAPAATGNMTFTAATLSILLLPYQAGGRPASSSAMPVQCAPDSGQDAVLATVPVAGAAASAPPGHGPTTATPRVGAQPSTRVVHQGNGGCPPLPPRGLKLNPRFPPPPPPPGSTVITSPPVTGCAFVIGFSDVRKLNGAALIGPGLTNLEIGLRTILNLKANYVQLDNTGELEFHGFHQFPPATDTLLAFGFIPVTATLQLSEIGTLNAFAVGPASPIGCGKCITTTTIYSLLTLRIYNVKVNGVPLNVGNGCRTVSPFAVVVKGTSPQYNIATGGPLSGTITVPDFSGCGAGENLDPIFNATISGPGNFVQLTQGTLCTPNSGTGCPPTVPKPLH